jgi:D-alanyl-D-alanine dipeptidase
MKKTIGIGVAVLVLAMLFMLAAILYLYVLTNEGTGSADKQPAETPSAADTNERVFDEHSDEEETYDPEETITEDTVFYEGAFELPINGSTGFAGKKINILSTPESGAEALTELSAGAGFLILREQDAWWEVQKDGVTGWVRHESCFINLPDIIPSIRYNCTNTYNSRFNMPGSSIPNITGQQLYFGRAYNERLGREEYICGIVYSMAGKIYAAQQGALAEGDCIVVYEAFRPYSIQRQVATAMSDLINSDATLNSQVNANGWGLSWFISTGTSNHQRGCAMDVGLLNLTGTDYAQTGGYSYLQVVSPNYYDMPTPIHELSINAATFTYPVSSDSANAWRSANLSEGMKNCPGAQKLQRYCTDAGLTPLASEWWHFNDLNSLQTVGGSITGDFILTECYSVPPNMNSEMVMND